MAKNQENKKIDLEEWIVDLKKLVDQKTKLQQKKKANSEELAAAESSLKQQLQMPSFRQLKYAKIKLKQEYENLANYYRSDIETPHFKLIADKMNLADACFEIVEKQCQLQASKNKELTF